MPFNRCFLLVILAISALSGLRADPLLAKACDTTDNDGYYTMESSTVRFENQDACFSREYQILQQRRNRIGTIKSPGGQRPQQLIGLALSGGGIKSSSFQLGLLSGLYKGRNRGNQPLLNEIDYLASVSGGSWANGAYLAAKESDENFFDCLDSIAEDQTPNELCGDLGSLLPQTQSEIMGSKDWQEQIVDHYLRGKDISMEELRKPGSPLYHRPFPIFLSTHSNTMIGKKSLKNFPFEITPFNIGTIADCNSRETPCGFFRRYLRPLHWNNPPEKGFAVDLGQSDNIDVEVKKYLPKSQKDLALSHAMWSSGGLVAKVFSLHLRLNRKGRKLDGIREKYVLSDGGKTDNLGLIPLVERGMDLVILSQIASDAELKFGDLNRASKQVERLFDVQVDIEKLMTPHKGDSDNKAIITTSHIKRSNDTPAAVWLIKPSQDNIKPFYDALEKSEKFASVLKFLKETQMDPKQLKRFPQNSTIKLKYPQKLMFAYYLLGKYIGENELSPKLNDWLNSVSP